MSKELNDSESMEQAVAYLDSSVLLRLILGEAKPPSQFRRIGHIVSSELLKLECLRTIDRLKKQTALREQDIAARKALVFECVDEFEIIPVSSRVLEEASQSFPTFVGTLDAIHLASALLWRKSARKSLLMLTHDNGLGQAARSMGFQVIGTD